MGMLGCQCADYHGGQRQDLDVLEMNCVLLRKTGKGGGSLGQRFNVAV